MIAVIVPSPMTSHVTYFEMHTNYNRKISYQTDIQYVCQRNDNLLFVFY